MKILIVGGGGREHALVWKLAQSPRCAQILCAPGNAGTAALGRNVSVGTGDVGALAELAASEGVDLTVVGPDDTLAAGIADEFLARGLRIFGPTRSAARLESSKVFAKEFMRRHGIPTAESGSFSAVDEALAFLDHTGFPVVVKADGLALGKGVIIAANRAEAEDAVRGMMEEKRFGSAGDSVLIEEFLAGRECSIHALVDCSGYALFPAARDHKRAFEADKGPNTGGMGTISPAPGLDDAMVGRIRTEILDPFVSGLHTDGMEFRGMLFPGLMITASGPKVLEFNCRFGDPETQVLLPRLRSDLLDLLLACTEDRVAGCSLDWDPRVATCVVMASGGYPGVYERGFPVSGLDCAGSSADRLVFHAGTSLANGQTLTSGGRVLGVVGLGESVEASRSAAYEGADLIDFAGVFFRRDIGI